MLRASSTERGVAAAHSRGGRCARRDRSGPRLGRPQGARVKDVLGDDARKQAVELLAGRVADDKPDSIADGDKNAALATLRALDPDRAKGALQKAKQSSNAAVVRWAEAQ